MNKRQRWGVLLIAIGTLGFTAVIAIGSKSINPVLALIGISLVGAAVYLIAHRKKPAQNARCPECRRNFPVSIESMGVRPRRVEVQCPYCHHKFQA